MINKHKVLLCILLCSILIVSLLSCQVSPTEEIPETSTQEPNTPSSFYNYESIYPYLKIRFCPDPDTMKSSYIDTLGQEFLSQYTAERSLTLSDRLTCSIYKIQSEDAVQGYLMMFFKKYGSDFCRANEYYFFSEALSQSQLVDLKVGDNLEALYDIDPSIYFDLTQVGRLISVDGLHDVIYKPLKDGILKLRVSIPGKTDEGVSYAPSDYTIQEIAFYAYGEEVSQYMDALPDFSEDDITWLFAE